MNARLKQARLEAGFSSATAAIETCGWNSSKYRAHENGQNSYKVEDAKMYAKAYGVSSAWLLVGEDKSGVASQKRANDMNCSKASCPDTIYAIAVLLHSDPENSSLINKLSQCVEGYSEILQAQ